MTWIAVAVAGATLVGGVVGSEISAGAAKDAANTQAGAARDANATQLRMFQQSRDDLQPYRAVGYDALGKLSLLANTSLDMRPYTPTPTFDPTAPYQGPSEADLRADPGYQFRVSEGQKALERSGASKGLLLSGGQLKDLQRFGQGLGAQEYAAVYQRGYQQNADLYNRNLQAYQTDYNTLLGLRKNQYGEFAGLAGAGQGAVNTLSSLGQNTANALNANTVGAGNARAAGTIGSANAVNAGLSSVGQAGKQYLNYQLLSSLVKS